MFSIAALSAQGAESGGDAAAILSRGQGKQAKGEYKESLADFDEAIRLKPEDADGYEGRGNSRAQLGDLKGSRADLDKAIELSDHPSSVYASRAMTEQLAGDFEAALDDYHRVDMTDLNDKGAVAAGALGQLLDWRMHGKQHDVESAQSELSEHLKEIRMDWDRSVLGFIFGRVDETKLLKQASQGDAARANRQKCQALYYIGMMRLIDHRAEARDFFEKSASAAAPGCMLKALARAELDRADKPAPKAEQNWSKQDRDDLEKIHYAESSTKEFKSLETLYYQAHGRFADNLLDLDGVMRKDGVGREDGSFMKDAALLLDLKAGINIAATPSSYRIEVHAKDSKSTVVVVEGVATKEMQEIAAMRK